MKKYFIIATTKTITIIMEVVIIVKTSFSQAIINSNLAFFIIKLLNY